MTMLKYYPNLILISITSKIFLSVSILVLPVWHNDKRGHARLSNMNINIF